MENNIWFDDVYVFHNEIYRKTVIIEITVQNFSVLQIWPCMAYSRQDGNQELTWRLDKNWCILRMLMASKTVSHRYVVIGYSQLVWI